MISSVQTNSGFLIRIAREAYERTITASSNITGGHLDAVVSIVFSSGTLEAFMHDAVALAEQALSSRICTAPSSVSLFVDALNEIETNWGSVKLKYMVAGAIFAGKPYDKGAPPYQDFALLIELRNALVHMKTKQISGLLSVSNAIKPSPPGVVKKLPQDLLTGDDHKYWLDRISTPALARWACNTAVSMIRSFVEIVPASRLREILTAMTNGPTFDPIP